ncbi:hypothetical protein LUZ60_007200 [Juncus effusus]|nr:hypothetical protein LUZ60_007200 [Juncus effusus]
MAFDSRPQSYYTSYKTPSLLNPILETPHISFLEDRYSLGPKLGLGQFGLIRSCTDLLTNETLACKSISKDRLISTEDLNTVKSEIEVMASLSGHPNIVNLKAVYEEEECVHLVMELCKGGELFCRLEREGRFEEREAKELFRSLVEIVMYCHGKGIVHRDLKPENILLVSDLSYSQIKLADFGLATYIKPGQKLHGTVGSPFYISPEVLSGGYNEKADIWSCGVILYILLSGIPPFWGKTKSKIFESIRSSELTFPSDTWAHVSDSAKDLICGMLDRDVNMRLGPKEVLEHEWIKEQANKPCISSQSQSQLNLTRDVSFSNGSDFIFQTRPDNNNYTNNSQPVFTCRSSFSAFLITENNNNNCNNNNNANLGFSFGSNTEESSDFVTSSSSSVVTSLPSFSFSPVTDLNQDNQNDNGLMSEEKLNKSSDLKRPTNGKILNNNDNRRKRNHTIGFGEFDQFDLAVSESVIRWASCTFLSAAPSLRSSLVC